ncbi:hypothetical protein F511_36547 [Dorcoceras hygrometricum]|uniref:Uncharacterized protein n=1 Tax=Dorcoceras hygrometricum TaxID=472368 RepID=A0A2Z7CCH2_9LAMI|nr:hypothetical protein F511_36547 [Dorcoceras hygrometricum]
MRCCRQISHNVTLTTPTNGFSTPSTDNRKACVINATHNKDAYVSQLYSGNSHHFRPLFDTCEVALDSSREALPLYITLVGCDRLVEKREVAARLCVVLNQISRTLFVVILAQEGERQYRTLISLLGSLATMCRVVNYHSSWARQRQVELFDASGIRV